MTNDVTKPVNDVVVGDVIIFPNYKQEPTWVSIEEIKESQKTRRFIAVGYYWVTAKRAEKIEVKG